MEVSQGLSASGRSQHEQVIQSEHFFYESCDLWGTCPNATIH